MDSQAVIFKHKAPNYHTRHWVATNEQQYLSLQTEQNTIEMFIVNRESNTFKSDETLQIDLGKADKIWYSEFDRSFENIFILKNGNVFEKRNLTDVTKVGMSIKHRETVTEVVTKQLAVSDDGALCVIGGGSSR